MVLHFSWTRVGEGGGEAATMGEHHREGLKERGIQPEICKVGKDGGTLHGGSHGN